MKKPKGRPKSLIPREDRYKSILIGDAVKIKLDFYKKLWGEKSYGTLFTKFMELAEKSELI